MSEAAHSSTYMTRSCEEVMQPSGWALFPTCMVRVVRVTTPRKQNGVRAAELIHM